MYLNPRADCCSFLPPCLPASLPSCLPGFLCSCYPIHLCLTALWHSSQPPSCSSHSSHSQPLLRHPRENSSSPVLIPHTYLPLFQIRSVCQHWTTPSPPLPPLWFSPPPPVPSRAGQGAGLRRPSHLQLSQRALVVPSRHTSISCSTLPIHPFVAERAAEPCVLSPKARWIPEVSISEPPSTRPRAKKNSRLVPAWWHWHTRSRLFGDP